MNKSVAPMANVTPSKKGKNQSGKNAKKPEDKVLYRRGEEPKAPKEQKRSKSVPASKTSKKPKEPKKNRRKMNDEDTIKLWEALGLS